MVNTRARTLGGCVSKCCLGALALLAVAITDSPSVQAAGQATSTHVVANGDTLGAIASRYDCSIRDLRALNGLSSDLIRIGQKLVVPDYTKASQKASTTKRGSKNKTGAKAKAKATKKSSRSLSLVDYKIAPGDSLARIAKRHGTTVAQLRRDNPQVKKDRIVIGRRLRIRSRVPVRNKRRFVYTIQPGDTLGSIGRQFNVSWPQIAEWNPKKQPKRLRVGSRINVYIEGPQVRSTTKGRPQRGRLVNGEQLPEGPGYRRQNPNKAWGTNETITQILKLIADVRTKRPRLHNLLIGDISRKQGGKLHPHISHQSGRDVDVGYYFTHVVPEGLTRFIRIKRNLKKVDWKANWTLIRSLVGRNERTSRVQHVFMSYPVQKYFYDWAKKNGVKERELSYMFQYPRGKRALVGKIRHVRGHTGHMHVRFKCPPRDVTCVM